MPRGGNKVQSATKGLGYTYNESVPHRTVFSQQSSELGVGRGSSVELSLGDHAIAEDLRSLGLPKKPLMAAWIGKMVMSFGPPAKF